ncbi:hypothetical protein [Billgrantia saliphila]|uniref:hypothetical protein n=1 Tax=Billgrantia saliphila TaxID=1848458 RepID=UPI000CE2BCBA|nr:hypothetical protein [Halomonas saliphila]
MTRDPKAAIPSFAQRIDLPLEAHGSTPAALLRSNDSILSELHSGLTELREQQQELYADLNRMQETTALFRDMHQRTLSQDLETAISALREGPAGQMMRLLNETITPSERERDEEEDDEERHVETVTLGSTDEDMTYDDMGDAALALNLSADERNEEYHGVFRFDGSGPAAIDTFLSEDPNPEYDSPSGTYHLPNSESVSLYVADDTGFSGTIHADAAQSLRVDAPGWFSNATLHGAHLTEATFNLDMVSIYEGDEAHGGTYHSLDINAENLERLKVTGDARFHLTSIADSDALQQVDASTDGELLLSGLELNHLEEVNLEGGGRVVFYTDEASTQVESVRIDAAELRGDIVPPGEDTLNIDIGAFAGQARGTAEIVGSEVGQNGITVEGRDLSYTGGTAGNGLRYRNAGELDDMASFRIHSPNASTSLEDVVARGELLLEDGFAIVSGDSLVETEDFYALTGAILHPESADGAVRVRSSGEVTLNAGHNFSNDSAAYNDAFFARDTRDTQWSIDADGRFDGTFDFGVTVANDDDDTLDGLLFEDDAGDLFYVLDTDADPGIEEGADAFRIAEAGEGWVDEGNVQSAAEVDAFIGDHALSLLGVGETTLIEHGELA